MNYFAYGWNMSVPRLQQRVPSARVLGVAILRGHRLEFHKAGRDGSAKCNAAWSGKDSDAVHGVLYKMNPSHKSRLDEAEGLGNGYAQKTVHVQMSGGGNHSALTYCATHINVTLRPYSWYLEHVMRGAREHNLPGQYSAALVRIEAIDDPDAERHRVELAIYA